MSRPAATRMPSVPTYLLARHGEVLTGRQLGTDVARKLTRQVRAHEVLLLSFAGVDVASLSFLDELLGALQQELSRRPSSMLVVYGINESVREHILTVLQRRRMVLAVLTHRGIGLLGGGPRLRRLMRAAQRLQPEFSTQELADRAAPAGGVRADIEILVSAGALGDRAGQRLCRPQSDRMLPESRG